MFKKTIRTPEDAVKAVMRSTIRGNIIVAIHLNRSMCVTHIQKVEMDEVKARRSKSAQIVGEIMLRDTVGVITIRNIPDHINPVITDEDIDLVDNVYKGVPIFRFCYLDHIIISESGHLSLRKDSDRFGSGRYSIKLPPKTKSMLSCKK